LTKEENVMNKVRTTWIALAASLLFCLAGCGPSEPEQPPVPVPPPPPQSLG
jgi:hypothetical protein